MTAARSEWVWLSPTTGSLTWLQSRRRGGIYHERQACRSALCDVRVLRRTTRILRLRACRHCRRPR